MGSSSPNDRTQSVSIVRDQADGVVVVRGRGVSGRIRPQMASVAVGLGARPGTVVEMAVGAIPVVALGGLVTFPLLLHFSDGEANALVILVLIVLATVLTGVSVIRTSEAVQAPKGSPLHRVAELAGPADLPAFQRTNEQQWAHRALASVGNLKQASALEYLPALVQESARAEILAQQVGLPDVGIGLEALWCDLEWTLEGVSAAAREAHDLRRQLDSLAATRRKVLSRGNDVSLPGEQRADHNLVAAKEAIASELNVYRELLEENPGQ